MGWSIRHWEKLVYLSVEVAYKKKILLSQVLDVSIMDKYILFMGVLHIKQNHLLPKNWQRI